MTVGRAQFGRVALALVICVIFLPGVNQAIPIFGEIETLSQPDGTTLVVRVWGDEYHQRVEDEAGYTLIREADTGRICYAELGPGGETLVSTGVLAGKPVPAGLQRGLRLPADVVAAKVAAGRDAAGRFDGAVDKTDYPIPAVTGQVRGIALLVDFSDEPASFEPAELEAFLNQLGYNLGGNNGSVRDYYRDISDGNLDLTHYVTPYYYRAAHPKVWYEDPAYSMGWRARLLVDEALNELERQGFDFSEYDANGDGFVDLVGLFYAGEPRWSWGVGLWPQAGETGFHADGVLVRQWHIAPMSDELTLGVTCHEIGHALCQWPDLYDTGGDSWGVGLYCLMSNPAAYRNPLQPCGPLKYSSGWTRTQLLDGFMPGQVAPVTGNHVFIVPHPTVESEFYMMENRQRSGRDLLMTDEGLAVYHVDWRGDNNRQEMQPDFHYMISLVQADGNYDLENDNNWGDDTDLFGAPEYTSFGPHTIPEARWWRQQFADLYLDNISAPGDTMTFDFRDGIGILPLQVNSEPATLEAPWQVSGADGYVKLGQGTRLVHVPTAGSYVVSWREVPGWLAPPAATVLVPQDGPVPEVSGTYTHPPFTMTDVPVLASPAAGRGGQMADYDGDGDLDLFLCRENEADLLLRNEGGWQFDEATPSALAGASPTVAATWADVDADGDRDLYVVRRDQPHLLLRQTGPGTFAAAAEEAPPGLEGTQAAIWVDYDDDGRLDLHLVRDGQPNLLLRAPDKSGPLLGEYIVQDILPSLSFARSVSSAWCDYDANGLLDLYTVNLYGNNVLAHNRLPIRFFNATHGGLGQPWRGGAAAWGDYDNDGDFDLYTVQDGASDVLFTQYHGTFVMEAGSNTSTTGSGRDVVWGDFDNDGDLDLYLARYHQPDVLLINDGDGEWYESPMLLPELEGPSIAAMAGDLDGDGGLDLAIDRDGAPALLLHNTMNRGHWLQIDPEGRGNLCEPVGAILELHVGDRSQLRQVSARGGPSGIARRIHFGLGVANQADSLVVHWPNGQRQVIREVAANQVLAVQQPASGGTGPVELPSVTRLLPAYPNPFNPGTNLELELAAATKVRLTIYDVAGRRVAVVHDGELAAGPHRFRWEGRDHGGRAVAAGVYLARLEAGGLRQSTRLALVK